MPLMFLMVIKPLIREMVCEITRRASLKNKMGYSIFLIVMNNLYKYSRVNGSSLL